MTFHEQLMTGKKLLVVSLPENTFEYAQKAVESGADGVKLHINVQHRATKKVHSDWKEVREVVRAIHTKLDCYIGIVPGAELMATRDELDDMKCSGVSFLDVYVDYAPLYLLESDLFKVLALNHTYHLQTVEDLTSVGADAVEVSIVKPEQYHKNLTAMDLLNYSQILKRTQLPAFVPTEKMIKTEEIERLFHMGFTGMIIGPVVTGTDMETFGIKVKEYSKVIQEYNMAFGNQKT